MVKRLGLDDYKRPKNTFQDKLTKEDIAEKLKYYKKVEDIRDVKLGTHVRYFVVDDDDNASFRLGGILFKTDGYPDYVVLNNGRSTWSVQLDNAIFFQKQSFSDLTDEIYELEKTVDQLKSMIKDLKKDKKKLKQYEKDNEDLQDKNTKLENEIKKLKKRLKKN